MELQIYKAQIDPSLDSDLEVNFMGLVDRPAIERNFQAFKEERGLFVVNEEKRIIGGPAMIADMPLYRNDKQLGEYYVVFDKPSIQTIVEKFTAKGYTKNFNLFHDQQKTLDDVSMLYSFVSDSELGIAPMKGYEDLPEGTWFMFSKVNSDDTWGKVKSGEIKGYSVEGLFNYVPVAKVLMQQIEKMAATMSDEEKVQAIKILSETNIQP